MNANETAQILEKLGNGDEFERREAAEALGELCDKGALPALVQALSDSSTGVAEAVADSLVSIGGEEAAEHVSSLLGSENVTIRNFACEILERIALPAADSLKKAMKSDDKDVRKMGADVAGLIGDPVFVPPLIGLLADAEVNVAGASAEALGHIGDPQAVDSLVKALQGDSWMKCSVIKALGMIGGKEAVTALESVSLEEEDMVVFSLVQALGDMGDENAITALTGILSWERPFMTSSIIQSLEKVVDRVGEDALKSIRQDIHMEPFFRLLNDEERETRLSAVKMIGKMQNTSAFSHIVPLLLDEDEEIRDAVKESIVAIEPADLSQLEFVLDSENAPVAAKEGVVEIFGRLRWEKGVPLLLTVIDHQATAIRRNAVTALGSIGTGAALEGLRGALKNEDGHTRRESALALGKLGDVSSGEALISLFDDDYKDVREAAARALSLLDESVVQEKVFSLSESENPEYRRLALMGVGCTVKRENRALLIKSVGDSSWEVRQVAVDTLVHCFEAEESYSLTGHETKSIVCTLSDENPLVRMAACGLINKILEVEGLLPVADAIKNEKDQKVLYELIVNLGNSGRKEALPLLAGLLDSGEGLIKIAVLSALGDVGDSSVTDLLESLLESEDYELAGAAESALEKIAEREGL